MTIKTGYTTVNLHRKAKDGDKGDNAVQYEIDVLSLTRTPNTPNTTYTVKWKARAYKTVGSERTPLSEDGYSIFANVGNGWKGYGTEGKYIFDDDDDFGLVTSTSITFGLFLGNSAIDANLLTTTVINFGEKGDQGNQGKRGASIRPCGEWKEGVTYVHDNDWIDVVIHNGEYYAVVEGKTATDIEPPHAAYWEEANKQQFVATDLLLTDTMYAKVLDAVNAKIDDLVVKRMQTATKGARIQTEGSMMSVYGEFAKPNIRFGVDSSGNAILKYYDNEGNFLYDLGPNGLRYTDARASSMKQLSGITVTIYSNIDTTLTWLKTNVVDKYRNKTLTFIPLDAYLFTSKINAGVIQYPNQNNKVFDADDIDSTGCPEGEYFIGNIVVTEPLKEWVSMEGLFPSDPLDSDANQVNITSADIHNECVVYELQVKQYKGVNSEQTCKVMSYYFKYQAEAGKDY